MKKARRYRKRAEVIEAMEWTGDNWNDIWPWLNNTRGGGRMNGVSNHKYHTIDVFTPDGTETANKGDYIMRGILGEFYTLPSDIFKNVYEEFEG